jgi:tetratricopeptide (TPR) repeat protein
VTSNRLNPTWLRSTLLRSAPQTSAGLSFTLLRGSRLNALGWPGLPAALALSAVVSLALPPVPALAQPGPHVQPNRFDQGAAQAEVFYKQAMLAFRMKNYQGCVEYCKMAFKADVRNKYVPHLCALAYSEIGDNYNAAIQFTAALSLDYNFIECHNNYGIFLNKKGAPEEAKKQFKECMRLAPTYPNAYYNLGTVLQQQGDLDGAVANYNMAIRLNPRYVDAHRDLGLALFQKFERGDAGEISESVDKLLTASKLAPDNPMIHYHLGYVYCCNGNLDEGEAEYRKALMCDSSLAAGHYELARLRYLRGDPNRALFEVKAAQKLNPMLNETRKYPPLERVKVKELEARCEELTENYFDSIDTWKEVASLTANNSETKKHINELVRLARGGHRSKDTVDPEEVKAAIAQGIASVEQGNLDEAKAAFSKAEVLAPNNFIPYQNLGFVYESQNNLAEAVPMYQKALDLKPKYDGLYYNMAYILELLDRRAEAGTWYKRFHEMAGKYPYDPKHIVSLQQEDARLRASKKGNY